MANLVIVKQGNSLPLLVSLLGIQGSCQLMALTLGKFGEDRIEHVLDIVQNGHTWCRGHLNSLKEKNRDMVQGELDASWGWNKCMLKRQKFNRKSINEALNSRPTIFFEDQWRNTVEFWPSSPERVMTEDGKEPDKLQLFEATYKPKRPETKLNDASTIVLYCSLPNSHQEEQEFKKDFPSYKHSSPSGEDEFVPDDEGDQDVLMWELRPQWHWGLLGMLDDRLKYQQVKIGIGCNNREIQTCTIIFELKPSTMEFSGRGAPLKNYFVLAKDREADGEAHMTQAVLCV
ncbi:hypothetical protein Cgig2_011347 [Carnegiea gigantea]|uniref:Uncharacterized protein n=1 Tax=Carnegiea gigantea TaxID=171969 RepID=A0A9Q1JTU6_9CARY|nr:hypothetical protein Cgig2_011347 [Carnegiea gigantea]